MFAIQCSAPEPAAGRRHGHLSEGAEQCRAKPHSAEAAV
jgi:hypothetical protein